MIKNIITFKLLLLSTFFLINLSLFSQDYALEFDGSSDYVEIPDDNSLDITGAITISAWIYNDIIDNNGAIVSKKEFNKLNYVLTLSTGYLQFSIRDQQGAGTFQHMFTSNQKLGANKWYHIAVHFTSGDINSIDFYIDGISAPGTWTLTNSTPNMFASDAHITIGVLEQDNGDLASFFDGKIDEVRIWNTSLSQSVIQDWMNREVTSSHPSYSNLMAYYKMSDGSGITLSDDKGSNDGTFVNSPSWVNPSTSPIGDYSIYSEGNSDISETADVNVDIDLTNEGTSYSYSAIQINTTPNSSSGLPANVPGLYWEIWANDADFDGTFSADIDFHFDNISGISDEDELELYRRDDDNDSWSLISFTLNDEGNNTDGTGYLSTIITHASSGDFSGQYIISSTNTDDNVLPIEILSFDIKPINHFVSLKLSTVNEENNDYFEVQRSKDGLNFETIETIDGAGNSNKVINYQTIDYNPISGVSYYRIKQTDFDGSFSFSEIKAVNFSQQINIKIYPNPASDILNIQSSSAGIIEIRNQNGSLVFKTEVQESNSKININEFASGVYILRFISNENIEVRKFIKR